MKAGRGFPIGARLLAIVLAMTLFMLGATIVLSARLEAALLDETRAQLGRSPRRCRSASSSSPPAAKATTSPSRTTSSACAAAHEISILSNDKQVVASSDKSKVGEGSARRAGAR